MNSNPSLKKAIFMPIMLIFALSTIFVIISVLEIKVSSPAAGGTLKINPAPQTENFLLDATVDVAKVFGRSTNAACRNASPNFTVMVADTALKAGLRPGLAASVIDQESGCDPYAVSPRGAVGEMQVMPKVWQSKFDFSKQNLFNQKTNVEIGCAILADLVNEYGEKEALRRYQGTGSTGNPKYTIQVIQKEYAKPQ